MGHQQYWQVPHTSLLPVTSIPVCHPHPPGGWDSSEHPCFCSPWWLNDARITEPVSLPTCDFAPVELTCPKMLKRCCRPPDELPLRRNGVCMNLEVSHVLINETKSRDGSGALGGFPEMSAENQAARSLATRCLKCFNCCPRGCVIPMTVAYREQV